MHWATGFHLTPGQAYGLEGADVLLAQTAAETVIADKGYDAQARVLECSRRCPCLMQQQEGGSGLRPASLLQIKMREETHHAGALYRLFECRAFVHGEGDDFLPFRFGVGDFNADGCHRQPRRAL